MQGWLSQEKLVPEPRVLFAKMEKEKERGGGREWGWEKKTN